MFEGLSDGDLIDLMGEFTRDESTAIAQRLAAVAELYARREGALAEHEFWCVDGCHAVAAEIGAVQNISHHRAVSQVQLACDLHDRLPAVARLFTRGLIDFRMVSAIVNRTGNVEPDRMPRLDEAIARHAEKWMKFSKPKLRDRIDAWVAKFDPAAVRVPPPVENSCYVNIDPDPYSPGLAVMTASLHAADGAALDQRLAALAATVCPDDPRTTQQRRAAAGGALARGEQVLACQCGSEDCTAAAERDTAAAAVIHVLAEQATLDGASTPGYLPGYGVLPAQCVRDLAATAKLTPVTIPAGATPEPRYRPSAKLTQFLRWRDLTCRWPGCDKPAANCDVDHTVPWPAGATHASDLKHYCRIHHLIKTFYASLGWRDEQRPDGTIVLTAPTGHIYTTEPFGATLFPALGQSTGELPIAPVIDPSDVYRNAMMPRRKHTREQDRQHRIAKERAQRAELIAAQQDPGINPDNDYENPYFPTRPPPPTDDDPPPF